MIIGITGTDGAGKGTVVEYLIQKKGFTHFSARAFLVEELQKAGNQNSVRNDMRLMGNKLRAEHGDEFLAKLALEKIKATGIENAVIESLRAVAEAEYIKQHGGILLAVDADVHLRFKRVQARRSESDKVDFATFVAQEELEKNDPDPNGMQKARVMEMADYTVTNNGSVEELHTQVEEFLGSLQA